MSRTLETVKWPDKIQAHVVSVEPTISIHGYDVESDLVKNYSMIETIFLTFTGELPTKEQARAFEIALQLISPSPVNEAPAHAAVLARTCATDISSIYGIVSIALSEQMKELISVHEAFIISLPNGHFSMEYLSQSEQDDRCVQNMKRLLEDVIDVPALRYNLTKNAAIIAVLHACGIQNLEAMHCALVWAKTPTAVAEAIFTASGDYKGYPVMTPDIQYEEV